MKIFIDTNIIMKEGYFRSPKIQALVRAAQFIGFSIIVPDLVLDEVKGNFAQKFPEQFLRYKKAHSGLNTFLDIGELVLNLSEKITEYNLWLDNNLKQNHVEILPYPATSLKEVVTRSYEKLKPFKDNGDGYKDYLIWESIKTEITNSANDDEIYFLTENVKDFAEKDGDGWRLHSHLASQIPEGKTAPELYWKFGKFFDDVIVPLLGEVDVDSIPALAEEDLYDRARDILSDGLDDYSAYGIEGLIFSNDITIMAINNVNLNNIEYQAIDQDEILITVSGNVDIEAQGFIGKHDYYGEAYAGVDFDILDSDWNDHVMLAWQSLPTPIRIILSYSKEETKITGTTIELVNEIFIEYY